MLQIRNVKKTGHICKKIANGLGKESSEGEAALEKKNV